MFFALILGFILGAAAIMFILQNTTLVALTFFGLQFESSIAIVVILAMLVGIILALLAVLPGSIATSFAMRKLRKDNESLARHADESRQAAQDAEARLQANLPPRQMDIA